LGRYAVDAQARSDALTVHAWGLCDLRRRGLCAEGLRLDASGPSLSQLTGGPTMGPLAFNGRLTGEARAWRLTGTGTVSDLTLGDFALARVTGLLDLAGGAKGLSLSARLGGAGGRGAGYAAALLGGAPSGRLTVDRLTNGQVFIKQLSIVGRGLNVEATGVRGLLGGLTLKGLGQISNLSAARPGASGSANLTWSAQQPKAGAAWALQVDARRRT
jgi:translocation and assembly module TamB